MAGPAQGASFKVFEARTARATRSTCSTTRTSLTFDKKPKVAEITIPGLDAPLKQFVRGETETLSVELFFDTTENGTGAGATSVTTLTDAFYGLVKIDPKTHAPPICSFLWGAKFPGDSLPDRHGNQRRTEFTGVVTSVKQDFKLFSPEGTPLRAVLTLAHRRVPPAARADQAAQPAVARPHTASTCSSATRRSRSSPGTCTSTTPAEWRHIADANGIDDPRRLEPGRTLSIPPIR